MKTLSFLSLTVCRGVENKSEHDHTTMVAFQNKGVFLHARANARPFNVVSVIVIDCAGGWLLSSEIGRGNNNGSK